MKWYNVIKELFQIAFIGSEGELETIKNGYKSKLPNNQQPDPSSEYLNPPERRG